MYWPPPEAVNPQARKLALARRRGSLGDVKALRVFALLFLAAVPASAETTQYQLEIDGASKLGLVKSLEGGDEGRPLAVTFADVNPGLAAFVSGFAEGKPVASRLAFSNGVHVKRAKEARVLKVRLPAMGEGGSSDVVVSFTASPLQSSPWLSPRSVALPPAGKRITGARVDAGPNIRIAKISAIEITQSGGRGVASEITIEGEPGSLPAMATWSKAKSPRNVTVAYVDVEMTRLVELRLEGCTPKSFVPTPATMTLACAVHG